MSFTYDLGRLRFFHRGLYNSSTQYELNDVVTYGGKSYVYINVVKAAGNTPGVGAYWALMADGQDYRGAWVTGTNYFPGDIIVRGGTTYVTETAHTAAAAFATDLGTSKWTVFNGGLRYRGLWAATTAYLKDDVITDGVNAWIATQDFTSNATNFAGETAGRWGAFVAGADYLPAQAGQANKVLTSDGLDASWDNTLVVESVETDTLVVNEVPVIAGANAATFSGDLTNPIYLSMINTDVDYTTGGQGSFAQFSIKNEAAIGTAASTDFIAMTDDGTDTNGWIDMGITNGNFDDSIYGITGPHDGYIFMVAPEGTTGAGNLVLATGATGTENRIVFAAGGLDSGSEQMIIVPNDFVHVEIDTPSTSPTTGAFRVVGGVGISGNLNVLGNTNIQGTITIGGGAFQSDNLTVSDPMIFSGSDNPADAFDLGYVGEYSDDIADVGPITISQRARTANVAVITTLTAHGFLEGDTVTIASVATAGFNVVGAKITGINSVTQFTYANSGATVAEGAGSGTATVTRRRKYFGMVRDADTDHIRFFENVVSKPTSTVNFGEASDLAVRMGAITTPSINRVQYASALAGAPYSSYPTGSSAYVYDEGRYYEKKASGWTKAISGDSDQVVLGSRIFG